MGRRGGQSWPPAHHTRQLCSGPALTPCPWLPRTLVWVQVDTGLHPPPRGSVDKGPVGGLGLQHFPWVVTQKPNGVSFSVAVDVPT